MKLTLILLYFIFFIPTLFAHGSISDSLCPKKLSQKQCSNLYLNNAPQIFTTDLKTINILREPIKLISWVIADTDYITHVSVQNKLQKTNLSNTVVIYKKYQFPQGRNLLEIQAIDQKGHVQDKKYLIIYVPKNIELTSDLLQNQNQDTLILESPIISNFFVELTRTYNSNPLSLSSYPLKFLFTELQDLPDIDRTPGEYTSGTFIYSLSYKQWRASFISTISHYDDDMFKSLNQIAMISQVSYDINIDSSKIFEPTVSLSHIITNSKNQSDILSTGGNFILTKKTNETKINHKFYLVSNFHHFYDSNLKSSIDFNGGLDLEYYPNETFYIWNTNFNTGYTNDGTDSATYSFVKNTTGVTLFLPYQINWGMSGSLAYNSYSKVDKKFHAIFNWTDKQLDIPLTLSSNISIPWKNLQFSLSTNYKLQTSNFNNYDQWDIGLHLFASF